MDNFIQTVITLFIILDPIGVAPMIQSMLKRYSPEQQRKILIREMLFALIILLLFFFSGEAMLNWLGLQTGTLSLSGGILLFLVALGMVFPAKNMLTCNNSGEENADPIIVPIAMPLMAGPASLAMVMLYATQSRQDAISMWMYAAAITCAIILAGLVLLIARHLLRKLGEKGTIALERMMGMVLILISVQMFMNGLAAFGLK